jgi:hypothetical protein
VKSGSAVTLAPAARQRMTAPASDRDELERSIFGIDA